jgi:hypothetical protein
MRKCVSLVCIGVLLSLFLIPAASATPPMPVLGQWSYLPYKVVIPKTAGSNIFKSGEENGRWLGSFVGTSVDSFEVIAHHAIFATCQGHISFTGTVDGKSGTLSINFIGKKSLVTGLWSGTWVILSGTDGLANLHGEGTWGGPGYLNDGEYGLLTYSGMIH